MSPPVVPPYRDSTVSLAATPAKTPAAIPLSVGAALVLTVAAFWPTLLSLHPVWTGYVYSHGYVVALITMWLLWTHRGDFAAEDEGWLPAFLVLAPLSVVWLFAAIVNVQTVHQAVLPVMLLCWGAAVLGERAGRALTPIAAVFFLAVPVWGVLVRPLQLATIAVSGLLVHAFGIEAEITGELIIINAGTFRIAGSCSGLNYLMVGLLLGTVYGHMSIGRWQTRLGVIVLAAATTIVSNWARVIGLIVIGQATDMKSSLMTEHGTYGWVVFTISLPVFFVLANRVERWERARSLRMTRAFEAMERDESLDTGVPAPESTGRGVRRRALLASGMTVVGPLVYFGIGAMPTRPVPAVGMPSDTSAWRVVEGATDRPYPWSPGYLGADESLTEVYSNGEVSVLVDRLVYRDQAQAAELINQLNKIAPDSMLLGERRIGPLDGKDMTVRDAVLQAPDGRIRVWYWYRIAGTTTPSDALAKVRELNAFFARTRTAELVAISTMCVTEPCGEAGEALLDFILAGGGT